MSHGLQIDKTGNRYGRLVVVERREKTRWLCRCDCGNTKTILGDKLVSGNTKSCGCYRREYVSKMFKTHGCEPRAEYDVWRSAKERCSNPNNPAFKNYGGRGIRMCAAWRNDFLQFLKDMGPRPNGLLLERINNDKGYSPQNCKWATWSEQSTNRRSTHWIEFLGLKKSLTQWAEFVGITRTLLDLRIRKGTPIAMALTFPIHVRRWKNYKLTKQ